MLVITLVYIFMDTRLLAKTDLNLLVALQVLLEERSVTRAAERLFVTQPAMSKTLQRLRRLFDDQLFVRSGRGLTLTPRAEDLERQLPFMLAGLSAIVGENKFDPLTYKGEIRLKTAEFIAVQLVPSLIELLLEKAPNLTLTLISETDAEDEELRDGSLDFVIEISTPHSDEYIVTPVGSFTPAVWMRSKHPLVDQEELQLADMLEYPFVQYFLLLTGKVTSNSNSRFDRQLAKLGLARKKSLVTNQFMTALDTLWHTDSLMLATMYGLTVESAHYDIVRKPYPKELEFIGSIPVEIIQHSRTSSSPVHIWLRERMVEVIDELTAGQARE